MFSHAKKISIIIVILIVSGIFTRVKSQNQNIIADLGFGNITAEEFKFRFELSPYLQTSRDIDSLKTEFLYTLLAEKLWAEEAVRSGFAENIYVKNSTAIIEKYYVRDALYKDEVLDKVVIPEKDLSAAIQLAKKTFEVKFLHSENEDDINALYSSLMKGAKFDSLLSSRPEAAEQSEPIYVVFGQMKRDLEQIIFELKPGEYSRPVPTEKGWMIFYVVNIIKSSDIQKAQEIAKKTLENRIVVELQDVFYRKYIKGTTVNADKDLFKILFKKIDALVKTKKPDEKNNKIHLNFYDFRKIKLSFSKDDLQTNFVKVKGNKIPLEYFLDDLAFNELDFNDTAAVNTAARLNSYLRNFIQSELIAAEGFARGLNNRTSVRKNVELWREHFLSTLYKNSFIELAKETPLEDVKKEFSANSGSQTRYRIRTLPCHTLEEVESVLARIDAGEDFTSIAQKVNPSQGELSDWFTASEKPLISEILPTMKIGEIFGPLKTELEYLIFQLADKQEIENLPRNYLNFLDSLTAEQKFNIKLRKIMANKTIDLARKSKIKIDYDLLQKVEVSTLPIFVYRYFGFGGRTAAVPYLSPFYEWYKKFRKESLTP